jgi:hypothetical protein
MRKCGKHLVETESQQMTIRRTPISRWIPKDTNTQSEYVIHIGFPQQQCLYERASMILFTYITSLVKFY